MVSKIWIKASMIMETCEAEDYSVKKSKFSEMWSVLWREKKVIKVIMTTVKSYLYGDHLFDCTVFVSKQKWKRWNCLGFKISRWFLNKLQSVSLTSFTEF